MYGYTLSGRKMDKAAVLKNPEPYSMMVLAGLQDKKLYQGTVTDKVRTRRRASDRVARASRKANR